MSEPLPLWRLPSRSILSLSLLTLLLLLLIQPVQGRNLGDSLAPDGPAVVNAPAILVFTDDPVHRPPETYVDQALKNLSLDYTAYDDMAKFEEALQSGKWDLVIFANDQLEPTKTIFQSLNEYVQNEGRLIIHTWAMEAVADAPLWKSLGVRWVSTNELPEKDKAWPLYWWVREHPIFNFPNEKVPQFLQVSNTWEKSWPVQHKVEPDRGYEPVAGYEEKPVEGMSGLVIGNRGLTIFRGFVDFINGADLNENKKPDAVELWENLIVFVLDPAPASFNKVTPANNGTDVQPNPKLDWTGSLRASRYAYCIDDFDNDSCDGSWRTTTASSVVITGLDPSKDYFWQVRAENPYGTTYANANAWWNFTTSALPGSSVFVPMVTTGQKCVTYPDPREIEPNDLSADANGLICFDYAISGDVENAPDPTAQDSDWFKFYWSGTGTLKIDVTNFLYDAQVLLYDDPTAKELVKDYWQLDGHYEIAYPGSGASGTYYVRLFAPDGHPTGNGDYTLTVSVQ